MAHENPLEFKPNAAPLTTNPELSLEFSDSEICSFIDAKLAEAKAFYSSRRYDERAEKNVKYLKGDQSNDATKITERDNGYQNNAIHRNLLIRAQNATSEMPDIVVMSPQQEGDLTVRDRTNLVEEWLKITTDSDVTRRLAKAAVIDNHLKFRGIWKVRYDHGKKDVLCERLRPQDVLLDHTARIPEDGFTADNMEWIAEWIDESAAAVKDKFPDKAEEIDQALEAERTLKGMRNVPSKMRYLEVWATMHKGGTAHEIIFWKYNDLVLGKGPNPYYDESEDAQEEEEFGVRMPQNPLEEQLAAALNANPQLLEKQAGSRKNFFTFARKPYIVFSGLNLGEGPLDETNVLEQSLDMQDIVNKRGRQIDLINDWAVPKIVTSKAYMTEEKAANITRDPTEIIVLDETENVGQALVAISGQPASPALYQDLNSAISTIDANFSTQSVNRSSGADGESGLSKQISREGDLAAADEIAQTMVQRAVEELVNWKVQLAKIFFDAPHVALGLGPNRSSKSVRISSALIPDDIQIVVRANAIDKATRRNLDLQLAGMKAIDPYTLYEDLGYPNPKEQAIRLIDFLNGPPSGYVKYVQDIGGNPGQPANQQSEQSSPQGPPPVPQAPAPPQQAAPPEAPQPVAPPTQ